MVLRINFETELSDSSGHSDTETINKRPERGRQSEMMSRHAQTSQHHRPGQKQQLDTNRENEQTTQAVLCRHRSAQGERRTASATSWADKILRLSHARLAKTGQTTWRISSRGITRGATGAPWTTQVTDTAAHVIASGGPQHRRGAGGCVSYWFVTDTAAHVKPCLPP
jgi:hypothetical protein